MNTMRNRKILIFGTLIVMLIFLISSIFLGGVFPTSATAQKVFKLKFADMNPPASTIATAGQWWASEVEKRTGGQVKVECFWGGSLVGAYEQLSSVKAGILHVTPYYSGYHPDLAPLPAMGLFPLINRGTLKEAMTASDEWHKTEPAVASEFKKNNVKYMFPYNQANFFLWSKVPIKSLGDLKGLRMRAFGPFLALFKELGCGLVSVPAPEIYTSLERGAVDATGLYLSIAIGFRIPEIVKYVNVTELGHNIGAPIVMHLDTWNSLPADIQKIIDKINGEMIDKSVEIDSELYKNCMKTVKDSGLTIQQFSPTEVEKLIEISRTKVWEPYAAKFDEKGIAATQALKHYIQLSEKYSKIRR
jgi:TRAP-type C4-dicarboxylate transport system substrate-binding protein